MEERFIELEECKDGSFREKRLRWWQRKGRSQRVGEQQAENETAASQAIASVSALFNVTSYDCFIAVAIVGIIIRAIILVIYVLTSHWVEYDTRITIWGLLGKAFWLYFDVRFIRGWNKYIRSRMVALQVKSSNRIIATLVKILAWIIAGSVLALAILKRRLSFFFMISKIMVMGSLSANLLLLVHRIMQAQKALESEDLPYAMNEALRRFFVWQEENY